MGVEPIWRHYSRIKLSMPCARVLTCGDIPLDHSINHLQNTWHFVSDLQWRGVSIKISSLRTRLNIDTPLHCKSDKNYHLFCKYNLQAANRGRWYRPLYFNNLTHICDKVNIVHLVIINGGIILTRSQTKQLQFPWIVSKKFTLVRKFMICVYNWPIQMTK